MAHRDAPLSELGRLRMARHHVESWSSIRGTAETGAPRFLPRLRAAVVGDLLSAASDLAWWSGAAARSTSSTTMPSRDC